MTKLQWRTVSHAELAGLLSKAELLHSEVSAEATVYHLQLQQQEMIAIALASGSALVVDGYVAGSPRRRHTEAGEN